MAALAIRNVDPAVKEQLRMRAARHGRSMEAELRSIVIAALEMDRCPEHNLADSIRRRFAPFGGVELEEHPPTLVLELPSFDV